MERDRLTEVEGSSGQEVEGWICEFENMFAKWFWELALERNVGRIFTLNDDGEEKLMRLERSGKDEEGDQLYRLVEVYPEDEGGGG